MTYLFEVFDDIFMCQLLLFKFDFEGPLIFPQVFFLVHVIVLCQFQCNCALCLQLRYVVLVLIEQVFDFLLVDL